MLLNVLRCRLTYEGQAETNAEAWFNIALRPQKPEGSLGWTAQDGHLDSHTAPKLCHFYFFQTHLKIRRRKQKKKKKMKQKHLILIKQSVSSSHGQPPSFFPCSILIQSFSFLGVMPSNTACEMVLILPTPAESM